MNKLKTAYKLARPDGWDFYTGNTVNYRGSGNCPHTVSIPVSESPSVCSNTVIHASENPNDCFVGARIPCSAYRVQGYPVCGGEKKWGFFKLEVIEEIIDLDRLFGWRYSDAINPINPFKLPKRSPTPEDIELLEDWCRNCGSAVWYTLEDAAWYAVWRALGCALGGVWYAVEGVVEGVVEGAVEGAMRQVFWAYVSSFFPVFPISSKLQSGVTLWERGLVPSFDGKTWRLHSGENAEIVFSSEA